MPTNKPNILFIFADQLRGSSLGHVGEEPVITPNLDAFARQGVRFTRAIANTPLCCPMRASLLTGTHPLTHGILCNDIPLREDLPTIAKSLKAGGYKTGYIGKWHLDLPDRTCFIPPGPRRQGFDDFWAVHNCNHHYYESYYYRDTPEPIWNEGYEPTEQTDIAINYLRGAGSDPFCLFLSWGPPHCPYGHVPSRFKDMYFPDTLAVRPNTVNPDRRIIANYYAHITALDWNYGRLMSALDEFGLAENTLVVFTSDHGDMLFSQDRGWKCKPWRESVNVPFIARWPGQIPAGHVETAPFGLVNVTPTLLSLCSADIPNEMEGIAYPQMLLGENGPRPQSTPISYYVRATKKSVSEWRGVVTERYTYARYKNEPWILYDDISDPYQMNNLISDSASDGLRSEMEKELGNWLSSMDDSFQTEDELAERFGIERNESGFAPYSFQPEIIEEINRRAETREERMRDPKLNRLD
ncbi:MAG: sulfatase [Armatimonadota bacterium]|nr:sulfatase [Armatimonadota bacterium]